MHRQLLNRGGIRKLSDNTIHERWSKPSQEEIQVTKQPSKESTPTIRPQPLQNDVICARGRTYWDHPGNQFYRKLISLAKKQYSKAPNRSLKTLIVTEIINHIHKTNGRFVKKVSHKGGHRWAECNTNFVREKVTQSLRDGLSFKYSSSTSRKRERKIQTRETFQADIDRIVHSNAVVSQKINHLQQKVELANQYRGTESEGVSDEMIMDIFLSANIDILETMKKDRSLLDEFNRVTTNEKATKKEKDIPTRCLSLESTEQTILLSSPKSGSKRLQTHSQSFKLSSDLEDELRKNSSMSSSLGMSTASNKYEQQTMDDFSCDDMDFDLESPSMFLDNW
jgi:hypothetical protein